MNIEQLTKLREEYRSELIKSTQECIVNISKKINEVNDYCVTIDIDNIDHQAIFFESFDDLPTCVYSNGMCHLVSIDVYANGTIRFDYFNEIEEEELFKDITFTLNDAPFDVLEGIVFSYINE